ncbi:hypothetical protein [Mucilaginibacter pedocola]|uniref:Uncharacterized protein n=1 Tax=Mucilaginibacter pedocola TaxID=1792845 RepID=A0A1S9PD25_9SPHI|nr:hypothetical protein [Mucilaginibacter pedocola]OOQ58829.1 hypothetical protein BC343_09290 [Mucilaginibacter pedocola]
MKRILSILCLAIVVLTASSCQKDNVVAPNNNLTILTSVSTNQWTTLDNGKTWKQSINMPELDSYANDNAGVLVYLSFTNGVYEQIPEVFNGVSYSYIHERGLLTIYAQAYDGNLTTPNPGNGNVKVVLIDSNQ